MNVVVDTSIWSLALRHNTPNDAIAIVNQLRDLIVDGRVVLMGSILLAFVTQSNLFD